MPYGTHRECHTDEHFSDVTVDLRGKTFIDCDNGSPVCDSKWRMATPL